MAEIKVSQLPEASEINDNDLIMIVQNNVNKKITKENCKFASGDEVAVSDTEPTGEESESVKLWINPEETPSGSLNPITNEYSVATDKGYSCNYLNGNTLYSDNTGTIDGITLSDSVANYSRVDIFYKDDNNIYNTTTIYEPNNKTISLQVFQYDGTNSQVVLRGKNISLSNTSLSNVDYYAIVYNGSGNTLYHNNNIVITKVIGYK